MDEDNLGSGDSWTFGGEATGYLFERASSSSILLNDFGWNLPLDDHRDVVTGSKGHISSVFASPSELTAADQEHTPPSAPAARSTDAVSSSSSEDIAEAPPEEKPPESAAAA